MKHLKVLACWYEEYVFPCLAKFLDVSTLNSVQSTLHSIPLMVLKTPGRNLCIISFGVNTTFRMSRNTLYINWVKVVEISQIEVSFICLSGVLSRRDMVLIVSLF